MHLNLGNVPKGDIFHIWVVLAYLHQSFYKNSGTFHM